MEKKIVTVQNTQIGAGIPKICIPLVAENKDALAKALEQAGESPYDMVEWRADYYESVEDIISIFRSEFYKIVDNKSYTENWVNKFFDTNSW